MWFTHKVKTIFSPAAAAGNQQMVAGLVHILSAVSLATGKAYENTRNYIHIRAGIAPPLANIGGKTVVAGEGRAR